MLLSVARSKTLGKWGSMGGVGFLVLRVGELEILLTLACDRWGLCMVIRGVKFERLDGGAASVVCAMQNPSHAGSITNQRL